MSAPLSFELKATVGALSLDVSLHDVSQTLVLIGPNGAGKSSLLSLLLGVRRPTSGRVVVNDTVVFDSLGAVDVPVEARGLAWVPQSSGLFPHLTVAGNLAFAIDSATAPERARRAEKLRPLVTELGLEPLVNRNVTTLSGGERQRVALARALCASPSALLLDEPLAALDVTSRRSVREFLADWLRKLTIPTIVVSHDADDARVLGAEIAVIEGGRITQRGAWQALVDAPATAFVREFTRAHS